MQNPRNISELLSGAGKLSQLKARSEKRSSILAQVRQMLPDKLAHAVVSAGVEDGRLTIGVAGAVWASRIRYFLPAARTHLQGTLGLNVLTARVRVVPPPTQ
jgi:hypothetical protein